LYYSGFSAGNDLQTICDFWAKEPCDESRIQKQMNYIISDVHGDLNSLLHFLIKTGFAFLGDEDDELFTVAKTLQNGTKIYIPNLHINIDFNGKLFILGDLIDRGHFSIECFYLVKFLINELEEIKNTYPELQGRLVYILGNHERDVLLNDFDRSGSNGWVGSYEIFCEMRQDLAKMLADKKIVLSAEIDAGIIGSHIAFNRTSIIKIFDFLRKKSKLNDGFGKLLNDYASLERDIYDDFNRKLSVKLSNFLNVFAVYLFEYFMKNKMVWDEIFREILSKRTIEEPEIDNITGFFQCVGHEAGCFHLPRLSCNRLYLDCFQSSGFAGNEGLSFPTFITFDGVLFDTVSFLKPDCIHGTYESTTSQFGYTIPNFFIKKIDKKLTDGQKLDEDEVKIINRNKLLMYIMNIKALKYLISDPKININITDGRTPFLFRVFESRNVQLIEAILDRSDLDIYSCNSLGESIFDKFFDDQTTRVRLLMLIHPGIKINQKGINGRTILHKIVDLCDETLLKFVLRDERLNVTIADNTYTTPFMLALNKLSKGYYGGERILDMLLADERLNLVREFNLLNSKGRFDLLKILITTLKNKCDNGCEGLSDYVKHTIYLSYSKIFSYEERTGIGVPQYHRMKQDKTFGHQMMR